MQNIKDILLVLIITSVFYFTVLINVIFLVPGILGSRLQGRMNRTKPSWPCKTHSNWEDLWLNLDYLLPYYVDCWVKDLK